MERKKERRASEELNLPTSTPGSGNKVQSK
jgi:hypothetical protein